MKFKGSFLTAASGSLGGITASHNRGGQYLRARLVPTDPASNRQMTMRSLLGALAARWLADLSAAQRTAWDLYAENTTVLDTLGDPIKLSGHQHFVRTNSAGLQASVAQINDGPIVFGTGELPVAQTVASDTANYTVTVEDLPAATTLIIRAGRPVNPSVTYFRGPFRFTAADTANPTFGAQPYTVALAQRQFGSMRFLNDDGRLSGEVLLGPNAVTAP